jgi:S-adenosylmethionine:tRNA ribosyltransferase-isomerase
MKTSDFDYTLPPDLIAQQPLPHRMDSRMMVLHRNSGLIEHKHIVDIAAYLHAEDLLVLNDTRVISARLNGHWPDTGGKIEVLLLEEKCDLQWDVMCRTRRNVRPGLSMVLAGGKIQGRVMAISRAGRLELELTCEGDLKKILAESGVPPVPPYIRRPDDQPQLIAADRERYQTVYARVPGAVAAPTAGLHFTEALLEDLQRQGVLQTAVTLHVGPGTFRPVSTDHVEQHDMESERFSLSTDAALAINRAIVGSGRIVAVGSTTVRTLEFAMAECGRIEPCQGRCTLFVYPPYDFRVVDVLLTNFHLPQSTLIMMVSAFFEAGDGVGCGRERILCAYEEAIRERYRFYSYGDCMLII